MPKKPSGDFWAVVSALATGCGLIAAKSALQTLTPINFNAHMFSLGAVVILVDTFLSRSIDSIIKCGLRQVLLYFVISVLFCGATFCFFSALSLAEPATVSFLSRLELITTLILAAVFLKEKVRPTEIIGLVIVASGIMVMRYGASLELSRAVLLVSIGSLLFGMAEVLTKMNIKGLDHRAFIFYRNIFMGAIFALVGTIRGEFYPVTDPGLLLVIIIAAILLPYLGRVGYIKAMQRINISRAVIIVQSQPFFAAAAAFLILGTFPSLRELTGGILIVIGVITIKVIEKRANRKLSPISPSP